ncbi:MAG: hypothetical protein ACI9R3_002477 [Verrucomicrobiales bacterium]|jgi:hypothetical protein
MKNHCSIRFLTSCFAVLASFSPLVVPPQETSQSHFNPVIDGVTWDFEIGKGEVAIHWFGPGLGEMRRSARNYGLSKMGSTVPDLSAVACAPSFPGGSSTGFCLNPSLEHTFRTAVTLGASINSDSQWLL